jgi:hypothetical protein
LDVLDDRLKLGLQVLVEQINELLAVHEDLLPRGRSRDTVAHRAHAPGLVPV